VYVVKHKTWKNSLLRFKHETCIDLRMMTLPEYLQMRGDDVIAAILKIPERTVRSWRRRERYPRPRQAAKLVETSGGKLDYSGVYAPDAPKAQDQDRAA